MKQANERKIVQMFFFCLALRCILHIAGRQAEHSVNVFRAPFPAEYLNNSTCGVAELNAANDPKYLFN